MNNVYTFGGLQPCEDISKLEAEIAIIGIPHGTPYCVGELSPSANAPAAIRAATRRHADKLHHYDFDLDGALLNEGDIRAVDCSDVSGNPGDPVGNCERAMEAIRLIIDSGAVPIVLGGDDSVAIPFFRAFHGYDPITLIQIDAHIDWRDEVNGVTEGFSSTMRRASELPWIGKIIQIGMRGTGSARLEEVEAAKAYGAELIKAREIQDRGTNWILDLIPWRNQLSGDNRLRWSRSINYACGYAPAPGGLAYHHVTDLLHGLSKKARIVGFDIVELAPEKDINQISAWTAARIVYNMIGALVRSKYIIRKNQ